MIVADGYHEKAKPKYVKIIETEERNLVKKVIAQIILKIQAHKLLEKSLRIE